MYAIIYFDIDHEIIDLLENKKHYKNLVEFRTNIISTYNWINSAFCTDYIFYKLGFYSDACIFNPGVNFDTCIYRRIFNI